MDLKSYAKELASHLGERRYELLLDPMFVPVENNKIRIMLHYKALAHIHLGHLNKAKIILVDAIKNHGENIGLIRDLSALYYQLNEVDLWRSTYQRMAQWILQNSTLLSVEKLSSCRLMLAKFYEEDGDLVSALELYKDIADVGDLSNPQLKENHLLALAQNLRLSSQFKDAHALAELYKKLILVPRGSCSADTFFEIEHALMLAEVQLVGFSHAWHRVEKSLFDDNLPEPDQRLMYCDYIEEKLIRKIELTDSEKALRIKIQNPDLYEEQILTAAFNPESKVSFYSLNQLANSMSWTSYLKLVLITLINEPITEMKAEYENRLKLLLASFSEANKQLWLRRLRPLSLKLAPKVRFNASERRIWFLNKEVDLSRKKHLVQILDLLTQKQSLQIDEIILNLWGVEFSPEHYHRLRMNIHRLNLVLKELTGIQKFVEIDSDKVSLAPKMSLENTVTH